MMQQISCTAAVFSPTGTTARTASAIAAGLGLPVDQVDLCAVPRPQTLPASTLLLAAVPVYGGRVPPLALQRLAALRGSGPAVAVAVYGNRAYDDALLELKTELEAAGFHVAAAAAFVAEHSIVRSIAAGRPNAQDLELAEQFGRQAAAKLADPARCQTPVAVPGSAEYRSWKGIGFQPQADAGCTGCGICAAACPAGAIPAADPRHTDPARCIVCMRCVSVCPQGARALPAPARLAAAAMLRVKAAQPRQPETWL